VLQTFVIVLVGLLAALFFLTNLGDLIPDDVEWVATLTIVVLTFCIVVLIRLRRQE
jgi:hypothetical protein